MRRWNNRKFSSLIVWAWVLSIQKLREKPLLSETSLNQKPQDLSKGRAYIGFVTHLAGILVYYFIPRPFYLNSIWLKKFKLLHLVSIKIVFLVLTVWREMLFPTSLCYMLQSCVGSHIVSSDMLSASRCICRHTRNDISTMHTWFVPLIGNFQILFWIKMPHLCLRKPSTVSLHYM